MFVVNAGEVGMVVWIRAITGWSATCAGGSASAPGWRPGGTANKGRLYPVHIFTPGTWQCLGWPEL